MNRVYLGLGANLGDRKTNLSKAIDQLNDLDMVDVVRVSRFYETEAISTLPQPRFINAAIEISTLLSPQELLSATQDIEIALGRTDKGNYDPRTLDLDILFYNEIVISDDDLVIPHPYLHERAFVLIPLQEIAGTIIHPVFQKTIHELAQDFADESILPLDD
jgi:2-amino-4-hydroxy-6-hydroxymethyldihydropteridine diphosphokinase